ncbi:hypothetical protein SKAU_G00312750, partial [Synaphobranchus kaupii]
TTEHLEPRYQQEQLDIGKEKTVEKHETNEKGETTGKVLCTAEKEVAAEKKDMCPSATAAAVDNNEMSALGDIFIRGASGEELSSLPSQDQSNLEANVPITTLHVDDIPEKQSTEKEKVKEKTTSEKDNEKQHAPETEKPESPSGYHLPVEKDLSSSISLFDNKDNQRSTVSCTKSSNQHLDDNIMASEYSDNSSPGPSRSGISLSGKEGALVIGDMRLLMEEEDEEYEDEEDLEEEEEEGMGASDSDLEKGAKEISEKESVSALGDASSSKYPEVKETEKETDISSLPTYECGSPSTSALSQPRTAMAEDNSYFTKGDTEIGSEEAPSEPKPSYSEDSRDSNLSSQMDRGPDHSESVLPAKLSEDRHLQRETELQLEDQDTLEILNKEAGDSASFGLGYTTAQATAHSSYSSASASLSDKRRLGEEQEMHAVTSDTTSRPDRNSAGTEYSSFKEEHSFVMGSPFSCSGGLVKDEYLEVSEKLTVTTTTTESTSSLTKFTPLRTCEEMKPFSSVEDKTKQDFASQQSKKEKYISYELDKTDQPVPSEKNKNGQPFPSEQVKEEPDFAPEHDKKEQYFQSEHVKKEKSLPFEQHKIEPPFPSEQDKKDQLVPSEEGKKEQPVPSEAGKKEQPFPSDQEKKEGFLFEHDKKEQSFPCEHKKDQPFPSDESKKEQPLPSEQATKEQPCQSEESKQLHACLSDTQQKDQPFPSEVAKEEQAFISELVKKDQHFPSEEDQKEHYFSLEQDKEEQPCLLEHKIKLPSTSEEAKTEHVTKEQCFPSEQVSKEQPFPTEQVQKEQPFPSQQDKEKPVTSEQDMKVQTSPSEHDTEEVSSVMGSMADKLLHSDPCFSKLDGADASKLPKDPGSAEPSSPQLKSVQEESRSLFDVSPLQRAESPVKDLEQENKGSDEEPVMCGIEQSTLPCQIECQRSPIVPTEPKEGAECASLRQVGSGTFPDMLTSSSSPQSPHPMDTSSAKGPTQSNITIPGAICKETPSTTEAAREKNVEYEEEEEDDEEDEEEQDKEQLREKGRGRDQPRKLSSTCEMLKGVYPGDSPPHYREEDDDQEEEEREPDRPARPLSLTSADQPLHSVISSETSQKMGCDPERPGVCTDVTSSHTSVSVSTGECKHHKGELSPSFINPSPHQLSSAEEDRDSDRSEEGEEHLQQSSAKRKSHKHQLHHHAPGHQGEGTSATATRVMLAGEETPPTSLSESLPSQSDSDVPPETEECPSITAEGNLDSDEDAEHLPVDKSAGAIGGGNHHSPSPKPSERSQDPLPAPMMDPFPRPPHPDVCMVDPEVLSSDQNHTDRPFKKDMKVNKGLRKSLGKPKSASPVRKSEPRAKRSSTPVKQASKDSSPRASSLRRKEVEKTSRTSRASEGQGLQREENPGRGLVNGIKSTGSNSQKFSSTASSGSPIYVDLAYIPNHCSGKNVDQEFFKRVRAMYYVVSGNDVTSGEPSRGVLDALLEGKAQWGSNHQVTLIPTHDTEVMRDWYQQTHEKQQQLNIMVLASSSTVVMQDESFPACKIEF